MSFQVMHCNILRCDECNDGLPLDSDHFETEGDAREASPNFDWRSDGEKDWCPACQELPHDCAPDPEDPVVCARCGDIVTEERTDG